MPNLKLAKLPDRTPVKISFRAGPELNQLLHDYADFYHERYGQEEPVPELIPYMLETFLRSDAAFVKARKEKLNADRPSPAKTSRVRSANGGSTAATN